MMMQRVYYMGIVWALLSGGLVLFTSVRQGLRERWQDQLEQVEEQT